MPLDPAVEALLSAMRADATFERPTETDIPGARRAHEHDAARFTPPERRHKVGSVHDLTIDGRTGPLPLRLYRPVEAASTGPTVVWFHGGGWTTGSLATGDIAARALCDLAGAVVVSVDYRLAPEHPWPAAIEDADVALRWAADHIQELGGNAGQLCVGGDSAGGNLAAVVASGAASSPPELAAQVLLYPVVDLDLAHASRYASFHENGHGYYVTADDIAWCIDNYVPDDADRRDRAASPLLSDDLFGSPPTVMAVAQYDPLRDQDLAYVDKLRSAGVPVVVHPGAGLVHGAFDMLGITDAAVTEIEAVAASLRALTETSPVEPDAAAGEAAADEAMLFARFVKPVKRPPFTVSRVGHEQLDRAMAASLGSDVDGYVGVLSRLYRTARSAARELLAEPGTRAALDALPWSPGDRIVALGDSITEDSLSWAEILHHMLELTRGDALRVVNLGITGDTTTHVISRFDQVVAANPTWVLLMTGTNDARHHGYRARARTVSIDETRRNLELLGQLVSTETDATLLVLTPPPVDEPRVMAWPPFRQQSITWTQDAVHEVAAAVRASADLVADVHRELATSGTADWLLPDGLHPSLAGQKEILRILLRDGARSLSRRRG